LAFRKRNLGLQQNGGQAARGCDRTADAAMAASDFFRPCPKFASRAAIMARCGPPTPMRTELGGPPVEFALPRCKFPTF
jgi:hypothetical protein